MRLTHISQLKIGTKIRYPSKYWIGSHGYLTISKICFLQDNCVVIRYVARDCTSCVLGTIYLDGNWEIIE